MTLLSGLFPNTLVVPGLLWAARRGPFGPVGTGLKPLRSRTLRRRISASTLLLGNDRRWVGLGWPGAGLGFLPRFRAHASDTAAFRSLLENGPRPAALDTAELQSIILETLELISSSWSSSEAGFYHQHYGVWKEIYFDSQLASTLIEWELGSNVQEGIDYHIGRKAWGCFSGRLAASLGLQDEWGQWKVDEIRTLLASQRKDGSLPYEPPEGKLEREMPKVAPGQMATRVLEIVDFALATGDRRFDSQVEHALDFLGRLRRIPRGGQTWEIDPHVPDLLATAMLARAFVRSAELFEDDSLLADAERWVATGLPFLVLQRGLDRPIMNFATPPALGVTRATDNGAEWLGFALNDQQAWWGIACPWVGLEFAQSLLELDRRQTDDLLVEAAEGIVATVQQMRVRDVARPRRIPDAFNLDTQQVEYPMWLVPRNLVEVCGHLLRRRSQPLPTPETGRATSLVQSLMTVRPSLDTMTLSYPEHAYIDLTGRCNLRCIICPHAYEDGPVSRHPLMSDRVLERLQESLFPHVKAVTFSCSGESLLHPRAMQVLAEAERRSFLPMLIHNGTLLRRDVRELLVRIGAYLRVSVDGASPEVFESIRVGAHYRSVMNDLRSVVELARTHGNRRFCLRFDTTVHRLNVQELADIIDCAADVGAEQVFFHHLYTDNIPLKSLALYDLPLEIDRELVRALERGVERGIFVAGPQLSGQDSGLVRYAADLASRLPPNRMESFLPAPYGPDRTYSCSAPWRDVVVKPDGNVSYCCLLAKDVHLGNLEHQSFEEIWFGDQYRRLREMVNTATPPPQCHPNRCGIRRPFLDGVRLRENRSKLLFSSAYPNRLDYRLEVLCLEHDSATGGIHIELSATNLGDTIWYAARDLQRGQSVDGGVRLGVQLCGRDGEVIERDFFRFDLPQNVQPGLTVPLRVAIPAPVSGWPMPGWLKVDFVCEGICWFEERGQQPLFVEIRDNGGVGPEGLDMSSRLELTGMPAPAANGAVSLSLRLTNSGNGRWRRAPGPDSCDHRLPFVRLGVQLCRRDGSVVDRDYFRKNLPSDVEPGATIEIDVIVVPPAAGWSTDSALKVDLVLEGSSWFGDLGQLPVWIPLSDEGLIDPIWDGESDRQIPERIP